MAMHLRRNLTAQPILSLPFIIVSISFLLDHLRPVSAANNDQSRLGTLLTGLAIYRSIPDPTTGSPGWNVLRPAIGTPAQGPFNLTLTTGVRYLMVSGEQGCGLACTEGGGSYDSGTSTSYRGEGPSLTEYSYYNPSSIDPLDLSNVTGTFVNDVINDARQDDVPRDMLMLQDLGGDLLDLGISGYWGLGIDPDNATRSIIPQVANSQGVESFTIGLDMYNVSTSSSAQAGVLDWGAASGGRYNGDFRWLKPRVNSTAGFWQVDLGGLSVAKSGVDVTDVFADLDPGYNSILVPNALADTIYAKISGAVADPTLAGRWIVACSSAFSFEITLGDHKWTVPDSELVLPRSGATCYGTIRSWPAGSIPGNLGTMVLGTPFLSQVYSVLYYHSTQSYVGIAGKPGTANDLSGEYQGLPGGAKAGIIVGILALLIAVLLYAFVKHRDSWEGMQNRMMRKQHRLMTAQMRMANPMVIPIPGIAPQLAHIAEPRHSEVYAPPYVPIMSKQNELMLAAQSGISPTPALVYTDDGGPPLHLTPAEEGGTRARREGSGFWGGWRNAWNVRKWRNHDKEVEEHERRQMEQTAREHQEAMNHAHAHADADAEAARRRHERHERRRSQRESRRESGHRQHHREHRDRRDHADPRRHHHHTPELTQSTGDPVTYTTEGYSTDQMGPYGCEPQPGFFSGQMGDGMQGGFGPPQQHHQQMYGAGMGMGMGMGMGGMPGANSFPPPVGYGGGANQFGQMPLGFGPGGSGQYSGSGGGQMPYGYNHLSQQQHMGYASDEGYYGTPDVQPMRGSFDGSPYARRPGLWDRLRGRG